MTSTDKPPTGPLTDAMITPRRFRPESSPNEGPARMPDEIRDLIDTMHRAATRLSAVHLLSGVEAAESVLATLPPEVVVHLSHLFDDLHQMTLAAIRPAEDDGVPDAVLRAAYKVYRERLDPIPSAALPHITGLQNTSPAPSVVEFEVDEFGDLP